MAKNQAREEIAAEIKEMVTKKEFLDEKDEFIPIAKAFAERTGKTESDALDVVTGKIVEFLPDYITEGLLKCSLDTISGQEPCRKAMAGKQRKLTITPGDKFPRIKFPTFYPYLEFILRAGPVDVMKTKNTFKLEGSMFLKEAMVMFSGDHVDSISGNIEISVKISLCKGEYAVQLHKFDKLIHVA